MTDVYVGLGSNIEPERCLEQAVHTLRGHFSVLRCSSVYRSPAYGFSGADFLNLVAVFDSSLQVQQIEQMLSAAEAAQGRPRRQQRFGPRSLDLDLLLYGSTVNASKRLPRADVLRYPFVLAPLCELAPELKHPVIGTELGDIWASMSRDGHALTCLGSIAALQ